VNYLREHEIQKINKYKTNFVSITYHLLL